MKGSADAQATQSSRLKPCPVIEKPKLSSRRLILIDTNSQTNVGYGSLADTRRGIRDIR